jgi:hypothetical protein
LHELAVDQIRRAQSKVHVDGEIVGEAGQEGNVSVQLDLAGAVDDEVVVYVGIEFGI